MKYFPTLAALSVVVVTGCHGDSRATTNRFELADSNHDRLLTQVEVGTYVAATLFDSLDKDRDNKLNLNEWNAGGSPMTAQTFRRSDADKNGSISESELQQAAIRSEKLKDFVQRADSNHDGAVSKPEALAYYASKE